MANTSSEALSINEDVPDTQITNQAKDSQLVTSATNQKNAKLESAVNVVLSVTTDGHVQNWGKIRAKIKSDLKYGNGKIPESSQGLLSILQTKWKDATMLFLILRQQVSQFSETKLYRSRQKLSTIMVLM